MTRLRITWPSQVHARRGLPGRRGARRHVGGRRRRRALEKAIARCIGSRSPAPFCRACWARVSCSST